MNFLASNVEKIIFKYGSLLLENGQANLIGAEFGSAYGGGIEALGKMWKDKGGIVYGFDTFEGHPEHLASLKENRAKNCMAAHYRYHGSEKLTYEYQRSELDKKGLSNVILRKGLINKESLFGVSHLNYAMLDLDLNASMQCAWDLCLLNVTIGGYVLIHDACRGGVSEAWCLKEVCTDKDFRLVETNNELCFKVFQRAKGPSEVLAVYRSTHYTL